MSRPYLQHGSRHLPFPRGSDPIPGLGQISYASLRKFTPQTVAGDNAVHYLSMEDGSTGFFETSDTLVFENAQNAGVTGSPWSIKCLVDGTYIVKENYFVRNGTAGAKAFGYHTFTGGSFVSTYQEGRTAALIGDVWDQGNTGAVHISFEEWVDSTTGNAPIFVSPYAQLASGTDVTVDVQSMVIYLGPYAGGNI